MIAALLLVATSPVAASTQPQEFCARSDENAREDKFRAACEVLSAERAFDNLAQRKGQWTAFRTTAATEAAMFVPQQVNAQQWLAARADPPASVRWQPHRVMASCDGITAVTWGAAQWPDGSHGRFMTIWQRQTDGQWKWVLDAGGPVKTPKVAPQEPEILVANCERSTPPQRDAVAPDSGGRSPDQSLTWFIRVDDKGQGDLAIFGWNGRYFQQLSNDAMPMRIRP